jgi:hypothetical protein
MLMPCLVAPLRDANAALVVPFLRKKPPEIIIEVPEESQCLSKKYSEN